MMHYGIADQHDFDYFLFLAGGDVVDHGSEEIPNQDSEVRAALREANPAHHVSALNGLGIKARTQAKQFSGREIEQLSDDGGGTEIDGYDQASAAGPSQLSIIGKHRHVPLFDLQL
jgi:hypothetical protein